jgi:hypothetical protein
MPLSPSVDVRIVRAVDDVDTARSRADSWLPGLWVILIGGGRINLRQAKTLTMRQNRNRLLIERFYLEMWNRFDKTIFPDILTEDLRFRGSLGQSKSGHAEFGEYVDFIKRAFPNFSN